MSFCPSPAGNAWHMGDCLLARMEFVPTAPWRFHAGGSARMSRSRNELAAGACMKPSGSRKA